MKETLQKVSLIIKTFERPKSILRLLKSIDKFYGKYGKCLKILIADDSRNPIVLPTVFRNDVKIYSIPFDSGVSFGRNYLLDKIETPYFITLDDDFVFRKETKIEKFVKNLEGNKDLDLVAGAVYDTRKHWWQRKKKRNANRSVSIEDGVLKRSKKPVKKIGDFEIYDFVLQFFIAKTDKIKKVKWNEKLKTVEHTAFFLDCKKANIVSSVDEQIKVNHFREKSEFYKKYRNDRIQPFLDYLHNHYGFQKDIEVD